MEKGQISNENFGLNESKRKKHFYELVLTPTGLRREAIDKRFEEIGNNKE